MKNFSLTRTTFKVSDIVGWLKSKSLDLSPSFQRRSVWKTGAKSFLIDTVYRGFPMPIIFLRERGVDLQTMANRREVVDGQQRIRTIVSFIQPRLLKDYNPSRDSFEVSTAHNEELAAKKFDDLPEPIQQRILGYEFSVHVLPADTDDREVLQIFSRMNATGVKLNAQELRNAKFYGEFKMQAYSQALKQLVRWRDWGVFNEDSISRMEEVELVSELMMFAIDGLRGKTQRAIDKAYADFDSNLPHKGRLGARLEFTFDQIEAVFAAAPRGMPFRKKALFYPLFVACYEHATGEAGLAKKVTFQRLNKHHVTGLVAAAEKLTSGKAPAEVLDAAARRTTHASSRASLINFLKGAIRGD